MGLVLLTVVLLILTVAACIFADYFLEFGGLGVTVIALLGIIGTATISGSVWAVSYRNDHWATCHVTDKDRGGKNRSYRVYTSDCDTLANEDSLFQGKWNSSNVWQQIEPGNAYQFRVVGTRIPLLSQFQNILEVKPAA